MICNEFKTEKTEAHAIISITPMTTQKPTTPERLNKKGKANPVLPSHYHAMLCYSMQDKPNRTQRPIHRTSPKSSFERKKIINTLEKHMRAPYKTRWDRGSSDIEQNNRMEIPNVNESWYLSID